MSLTSRVRQHCGIFLRGVVQFLKNPDVLIDRRSVKLHQSHNDHNRSVWNNLPPNLKFNGTIVLYGEAALNFKTIRFNVYRQP